MREAGTCGRSKTAIGHAWTAASLGLRRSGIEPTEAEAERAAQQEIERMLSEARAAALTRRELPVRDDHGKEFQPQS
jgi:hypothetical protein